MEFGQFATVTRPVGARAGKYARLWTDVRFIIQRTGRDENEVELFDEAWHPGSAGWAKRVGKAFGLGQFVAFQQIFATVPADGAFQEQVTRVTGPGCLAAA